jgi:thiamine transport system substrate-binding protein
MRFRVLVSGLLVLPLLAACGSSPTTAPGHGASPGTPPGSITLVTYDSWSLPKKLMTQFTAQTGITVKVVTNGDAGQLTNKLVLTAGNPLGDVAFGVDNTFASRATSAGVFDGGADGLTPVDHSAVCVNVDDAWFADHQLAPPASLDDLIDPRYKDLFVTSGAATSSPGMAFLLATIAAYGDGWQDYWKKLVANGAEVVDGWNQAYEVEFTQGGGNGTKPIVLSYDSDPAFTVSHGTTTTSALLDTCFGQTEYAGVLAGAENPEGAQKFVDWLLSPDVQKALPTSMYVFPVVDGTPLPKSWAKFVVQPTSPLEVDPDEIDAHRDEWLQQWQDIVS